MRSRILPKSCPVWHGWPADAGHSTKKGVALEVNGACASGKSGHFCIASCEASQSISSDFLLHLLLLPYFSCCLCNISLNVHMSAH